MASYHDLAPQIVRQRLVIEGYPAFSITNNNISAYLSQLSYVLEMKALIDPITNRSHEYGWAAWIHWEQSGAHFYSWDQPLKFFSIDIYTCKAFSVKAAVDFSKEFFDAKEIVHKSF